MLILTTFAETRGALICSKSFTSHLPQYSSLRWLENSQETGMAFETEVKFGFLTIYNVQMMFCHSKHVAQIQQ